MREENFVTTVKFQDIQKHTLDTLLVENDKKKYTYYPLV